MNAANPKVWLKTGREKSLRRKHPWVFSGAIERVEGAPASGATVDVVTAGGEFLAQAAYSPTSQIRARVWTFRPDERIDAAWFRARLKRAIESRRKLGMLDAGSACRLVFAESDGLPGLIVDRYGEHLVCQFLSAGAEVSRAAIVEGLQALCVPRGIFERSEGGGRHKEGLKSERRLLAGEAPPGEIEIETHGVRYLVDLAGGQKTGAYLDQRENRRAARRYAHGRALDAFSYAGGFALQISEVCDQVEAVDISGSAVALAQANAERNGLTNIQCIEANVFDFLRERSGEGARYDTIVLDPPAFAKNKESLEGALRGYKEINNRAMRLLRPGGVLVTCSCSHHLSEGMFAEMLAEAAKDAHVWVRVLERRIQSSDHPVLLTVPETLYLKCFILEILY